INQSFFVNVSDNFTASPFLYLMLMGTWLLGSFIFLGDLIRSGKISYAAISNRGIPGRLRNAALIFLGMLLIMAVGRFLLRSPDDGSATDLLGFIFPPIWAFLGTWAAIRLLFKYPSARFESAVVATLGIVVAIPVLFTGAILYGTVMFVGCAAVLYLIWDRAWNNSLLPIVVLALFSFGLGFVLAAYHTLQIRAELLQSPEITASTPVLQQLLLEVNQLIGLMTTFYIFAFVVLSALGLTIAWLRMKRLASWGSMPGFIAALLLIPIAFYLIWLTNLRVTQADMAFNRAELWSQRALASGELGSWDAATTAYQRAIELDPAVETYHRQLGEAHLERSAVTVAPGEQELLLSSAESELLLARDINPLNTDNTTNLARFSARWARLSQGEDREQRISLAADYYDSAMSLSPQNSFIVNEYAQLVYELQNDCQKSLALYDYSVEVDPFYRKTRTDRAAVYLACGDRLQGEEKQRFHEL
ncbi:MAG: tetratricopeptide repeat protein, partial [Anaerolineaceae bacterium]